MAVGEWCERGACKALGPEFFYPEIGVQPEVAGGPVEGVCLFCPVRLECLDHGFSEMYGTWGGWRVAIRDTVRRWPRRLCIGCGKGLPRHHQRLFCGDTCLAATVERCRWDYGFAADLDQQLADLQARATAENRERTHPESVTAVEIDDRQQQLPMCV